MLQYSQSLFDENCLEVLNGSGQVGIVTVTGEWHTSIPNQGRPAQFTTLERALAYFEALQPVGKAGNSKKGMDAQYKLF